MRHRNTTDRSKASGFGAGATIQTTLYQLIEAVSEALPPGDDVVVAVIVNDILNHWVVDRRQKRTPFH